MYDLGIIGGMGPLASVEIYKRIILKTKAINDQEHMKIVILNKPSIPDRTSAILNGSTSPVNDLNECIKELVSLETKNFIIACNTAHYFVNELVINDSINFINMIDEVLKAVYNKYKSSTVVILSTTGTRKANIYKTSKHSKNLNLFYPDEIFQNIINDYIYKIKAGSDRLDNIEEIVEVLRKIENLYPNCIFLTACTELSLVSEYLNKHYNVIDAVDLLVSAVILKCGYKEKKLEVI